MNFIGLFDGIACAYLALKKAGHYVETYISSEINKHAKYVANLHVPNILEAGDVRNLIYENDKLYSYQYDWKDADKLFNEQQLPIQVQEELLAEFINQRNNSKLNLLFEGKIDLLAGGSPCQDVSFAGKLTGLYGNTKSSLFWNYNRLVKEIKPRYFFLENTKMPKKWKHVISKHLGVDPLLINSALLSGQNRERLYWTNIPHPDITKIETKLEDILIPEKELDKKYFFSDEKIKKFIAEERIKFPENFKYCSVNGCAQRGRYNQDKKTEQQIEFRKDNKSNCITTVKKDSLVYIGDDEDHFKIRTLHPIEGERLQTLPDNYTKGVPESERWKLLGNCWTVDVITEFFKKIV